MFNSLFPHYALRDFTSEMDKWRINLKYNKCIFPSTKAVRQTWIRTRDHTPIALLRFIYRNVDKKREPCFSGFPHPSLPWIRTPNIHRFDRSKVLRVYKHPAPSLRWRKTAQSQVLRSTRQQLRKLRVQFPTKKSSWWEAWTKRHQGQKPLDFSWHAGS